ncbi:MAG: tetratricopeptide repeat protein, partial [Okeania sp. SIO3H1]|nr:tetratricopeptide repeat protein [Okeania sp. SIO3H1]
KEILNKTAALPIYRKAINLEPNMAAAYWNLGKILEQEGRFYEAFFFQEKALEIQPDLVENVQTNNQDNLFKKWHSQ